MKLKVLNGQKGLVSWAGKKKPTKGGQNQLYKGATRERELKAIDPTEGKTETRKALGLNAKNR